jgi:hypothetical protein
MPRTINEMSLLNTALGSIFLGSGIPGIAVLTVLTFLGILIAIAANNSN